MAKNFPNLSKDTNVQIQEDEQSPNTIKSGKFRSKHIMLKFWKTKYQEEILKAVRERRYVAYSQQIIGLTKDFTPETMKVRRK